MADIPLEQDILYHSSPGIRQLQLQGGDPMAYAVKSADAANSVGSSVPSVDIGRMMNIVRQYQNYGKLLETDAQREQINRATAPLPSNLAGLELSGAQQLRYRQGEANSVEPTLSGVRSLIRETDSLASNWDRIKRESDNNQQQLVSDARWLIGS